MNNKKIQSSEMRKFQAHIWSFYAKNRRDLPWRNDINPYRIVVSEIMLQQTQAGRVVDKFNAFIEAFPDFGALNRASSTEVLRLWKGLGYNRRALALKRIATQFADTNSVFPRNPIEIDLLPSIGPATAASIAVFAFNEPHTFIETNVRRVFIHHFFKNRRKPVSDNEIFPLVEASVDVEKPRDWYYALMDYGSFLVKQVPNPNRKSKHYTKQSKFNGSNRQIRGLVLEAALKKEGKVISQSALLKYMHGTKWFADAESGVLVERLNDALIAMQNEGFLVIKGKMVHINE